MRGVPTAAVPNRTARKVRMMILLGLLALLLLLTALAVDGLLRPNASWIATAGYIYGFPILLMDETRDGFVGSHRDCINGEDINTFHHIYNLPDPNFRAVVRPNVDTLYSSAMLDLSQSPMELYLPAVEDRYVLLAFLDAWSNNFAGIGTPNQKDEEGFYLITGPGWKGDVPKRYQQIESPTEFAWIIGRTEVLSDESLSVVNDIQERFVLKPYLILEPQPAPIIECQKRTPPAEVIKNLSPEEYFTRLDSLLRKYPTPEIDKPMLRRLAQINVGPLAEDSVQSLNVFQQEGVVDGVRTARRSLDLAVASLGIGRRWSPSPGMISLGDYKDQYFIRAVVAMVGFGANRGEFAVYQNLTRDDRFAPLNGRSHYTLTFTPGNEPPVSAFWSVTVYDPEGFLTANRAARALGITRYALGSNSGMQYEADGRLVIHLSAEPPQGVAFTNWLPVPDDNFEVTLRMYDPQKIILDGDWTAPMIHRED